ncbi:hypothetical protein GCM10017744_016060 [Streptomyces antimycoticus]
MGPQASGLRPQRVSLRPESAQGTTSQSIDRSATGAAGSGPCSSTTCTFVPLTPKADTPARRGRPVPGHSRASVSSSTAPADQSTSGESTSAWRVFGSTPRRSASTILMIPATPEAAWVWPMLDFSAPSHSGRSASRPWP